MLILPAYSICNPEMVQFGLFSSCCSCPCFSIEWELQGLGLRSLNSGYGPWSWSWIVITIRGSETVNFSNKTGLLECQEPFMVVKFNDNEGCLRVLFGHSLGLLFYISSSGKGTFCDADLFKSPMSLLVPATFDI
jgi:hypothetical protein